jgi:hypothetical protein
MISSSTSSSVRARRHGPSPSILRISGLGNFRADALQMGAVSGTAALALAGPHGDRRETEAQERQ